MYHILLNKLEKPKFDIHVDGALVNSRGIVQPNIFCHGNAVKSIADASYSVVVHEELSMPGKLRDKLSLYVHNCVYMFVVSKKVQDILNRLAGDQVEFFPFLFNYGETEVRDYKIVNVLHKIDCIDYRNSELQYDSYDENDIGDGSISSIDKLVLNTAAIPENINIFLLERSIDPVIIFHERIKKQIEELSLSGFVFCLPEDFQM